MTQMPRVKLLAPAMMPLQLARLASQQMTWANSAAARAEAKQCWTLKPCSCRCVPGRCCGREVLWEAVLEVLEPVLLLLLLLLHAKLALMPCLLVCQCLVQVAHALLELTPPDWNAASAAALVAAAAAAVLLPLLLPWLLPRAA